MQPTQATTVLLVERRPLIRRGLSLTIGSYPDFVVVGEAGSSEEALSHLQRQPPDVMITDIDSQEGTTVPFLLRTARRLSPKTRIIILTNSEEPQVIQAALREGAAGYLLKSTTPDELAHAIRSVFLGRPALSAEVTQVLIDQAASPLRLMRQLTLREQQVLRRMAQGWNNQQIAAELNITLSTVQFHVGNIFEKLQVRNRTEAAAFAFRHQIAWDQPPFPGTAQD